MKVSDIAKFENKNNLTVNVFGMGASDSKPFPMYISKNFKIHSKKHINLLLYKNHYIFIRNLSTFIRPYFWKRSRYFCHKCLISFTDPLKCKNHYKQECLNISYTGQGYEFPPKGETLKFTHFKSQIKTPFAIYADFESYQNLDHKKQPTEKSVFFIRTHPQCFWRYINFKIQKI